MPLHNFRCPVGHVFEQYQRSDQLTEHETCWCGEPGTKVFLAPPMVRGDYSGYNSPVTGEWIEGRRARREDLARHECVEYDPSIREHNAKRREAEARKLERAVEQTVEAEIHNMPARKREKLAGELEAGLDVGIERRSA